jgi:hypothetical protein
VCVCVCVCNCGEIMTSFGAGSAAV